MFRNILVSVLLTYSVMAIGAESQMRDVTVSKLVTNHEHNYVAVKVEGGTIEVGQPGCVSRETQYVFSETDPNASMTLSLLTTALVTDKKVDIKGRGDCGVHSGMESLKKVELIR